MKGTIVERPSPKRYKGRSVKRFYIVYQVDGKPKWEAVRGKDPTRPATRQDAQRLLTERLSQLQRGDFIQAKPIICAPL